MFILVTETKRGFHGQRLKEVREGKKPKMSQGDLADEMNSRGDLSGELKVKQQYISMWETGSSKPNAVHIGVLIDIFSDDAAYIMGMVENANEESPALEHPDLRSMLREVVFENKEDEIFEMLAALIKEKKQRGVSKD